MIRADGHVAWAEPGLCAFQPFQPAEPLQPDQPGLQPHQPRLQPHQPCELTLCCSVLPSLLNAFLEACEEMRCLRCKHLRQICFQTFWPLTLPGGNALQGYSPTSPGYSPTSPNYSPTSPGCAPSPCLLTVLRPLCQHAAQVPANADGDCIGLSCLPDHLVTR